MNHTNLKRYAVGQKLDRSNSTLLNYLTPLGQDETGQIPVAVVAQEFESLLADYQHPTAEAILDQPDQFLLEHYPMSFVPHDGGLAVRGVIDDAVLEIMEKMHQKSAEDVARQHIESSIKTINPDSEITITKLSLSEQVEQLASQVTQHQKVLENDDEVVNDVVHEQHQKVLENDDEVVSDVAHEEMNDDSAEVNVTEVFDKPQEADSIDSMEEDEGLVETQVMDEDPVSANADDDISADVTETSDIPVDELKAVYNSLIQSIKDKGIEDRVNFDQPLVFAR